MISPRVLWPAAAAATILFYFIPLFSPRATIHWDLADVHYPAQAYLADSLREGSLPHWTPYIYSGTPFLADPRTGSWYPLHWPFLLAGVTPRTMFWELALHSLLALMGAFLLARRMFGEPLAAVIAGMLYAWNGFFSAYSSMLPSFEAASLLPWLLWSSLGALESGGKRWLGVCGLTGGLIVLTGDFETAVYCLFAMGLLAIAWRGPWKRVGILFGVAVPIAFLAGGVVLVPWLSIADYVTRPGEPPQSALSPSALATIFNADHFGMFTGLYSGPGEIRQSYFYGGLLLLPLAAAGLIRKQRLIPLLVLILAPLWYAFGPVAGLGAVAAGVPGYQSTAPVQIWFVIALALALAAGSGAAWIGKRLQRKRLPYVLIILIAADLWHWNMYRSPLVYAPVSYEDLYGKRLRDFAEKTKDAGGRVWAPSPNAMLGPLNGSLLTKTEVTYGSGFVELKRYSEYMQQAATRPELLNALAVTRSVDARGRVAVNPRARPLVTVGDATSVDAPLTIGDIRWNGRGYVTGYEAQSEAFLRIAVPWAPGWKASVDGAAVDVLIADQALIGVIAPSGKHELVLEYRTQGLMAGLVMSVLGFAGAVFLILAARARALPNPIS